MKKAPSIFSCLSIVLGIALLASPVKPASAAVELTGESYKSHLPTNGFTFGAMGGFGLIDTRAGFSALGSVAAKVVKDGFVPEIVNPVFLELQFGPVFASGEVFWMYSTHLRWDFVKDKDWTLFAIGGFGGNVADNKYADRVTLHPRFGIGAFYAMDFFDLRMDFSREAITVGASLPF